ncbi:hypothetical protein T484DRAFT_1757848 [Baffinella frigidus]|nr:hypothetical protein T484DRAFT_1757848 [Cryptophyta sp. CCMP2293]
MPWRDVIFTGDSIILPPSWTQPGMNHAASFVTGGIELPPSVSEEERVLLDLLLAQPETRYQAKPRSPAKRVLLDSLKQTEAHFQDKPRRLAQATREATTDALSTATTPAISRCGSVEMDSTPCAVPEL